MIIIETDELINAAVEVILRMLGYRLNISQPFSPLWRKPQRLTALATILKRYTKEVEARRMNRLFTTELSKL